MSGRLYSLRVRDEGLKTAACTLALTLVSALPMSGCRATNPIAERAGKTFYLDGAGNWGFGASEVPTGLKKAGYRGDVEVFNWTLTLNPLLDQMNYLGARLRARELADRIVRYKRKYPNNEINIIALSAGTGVATWAVEKLPAGVNVNNLVLLGSSLSHDYDVTKALDHMSGNIYAYHSPRDAVLKSVRVVGTIDRKIGVDSIGQVGLTTKPSIEDRVVNIGWSPRWKRLGWSGGHTDCLNPAFVRKEIASRILPADTWSDEGEVEVALSLGTHAESGPTIHQPSDTEPPGRTLSLAARSDALGG